MLRCGGNPPPRPPDGLAAARGHGTGRIRSIIQRFPMQSFLRPLCVSLALLAPLAAPAQAERAQQGLLALFVPAQREATRAMPDLAARNEVKAAVKVAMANPPRGRIWCVPFARAVSGVEIRGNAKTWWDQAKGRYARGAEPRVGAVMAFAASRSMPKGHVAVVSKVIDARTVLVDQANWERNRITLDTVVVDVSEKGDWSRVRVANGAGTLGRVNPVHGFIYN